MKIKSVHRVTIFFMLLSALLYISSCKKQELKMSTTDDVNILGYLEKNPDSFSLFTQILDRTENSAYLNAYGNYTIFAPTNTAVKKWLSANGAASVEAADINTLKELVKFHLLPDTVTTGSFKDGKLPVATLYGQFIITGVSFKDGISSYTVNRQAAVLKTNIKVGNGIIHVIDNVLVPARLTIAQQLEAIPDYSIFVQAMKETGYYEMLNTVNPDSSKRWKTVIAESNQILADSGFNSYAELKARYSNTGNPLNPLDSLNLYVAYHILDGIKFLGDIITAPSHQTLQPQEVISTQLINQEVVVNEDIFNGVVEPGILLVRAASDNSATNGVWHSAGAHFKSKFRKPTAVFWDLATFPEIMKLTAYYKKGTFRFNRQSESDRPVKDINWHFNVADNYFIYMWGGNSSLTVNAYNQDILTLPLGPPSRPLWFEFNTPVIIKGRYKVWICYRNRNRIISNVRVDDQLMQRPVNFGEGRPAGSDAELESIGWKRYTASTTGNFASRLVGTVDIKTTERHKLRLEILEGTNRDGAHIDMVHFIPVEEPQYLPRFMPDGTKVYQ